MTTGTVGDYLERAREAMHVAARASSPEMADSLLTIAAFWQKQAAQAQAQQQDQLDREPPAKARRPELATSQG